MIILYLDTILTGAALVTTPFLAAAPFLAAIPQHSQSLNMPAAVALSFAMRTAEMTMPKAISPKAEIVWR